LIYLPIPFAIVKEVSKGGSICLIQLFETGDEIYVWIRKKVKLNDLISASDIDIFKTIVAWREMIEDREDK